MKVKGNLSSFTENSLIGFDAEWTKNYRVKNGNVPFCFSLICIESHEINIERLLNGNLKFKYIQYYCESKEEFRELVVFAEEWFSKVIAVLDSCFLCGHQISSDFSVLYNIGKAYEIYPLTNLYKVRQLWSIRKQSYPEHIIDTRYDISQAFLGKSRRLVDMCSDFYLDVTQPELKSSSMTKLQNIFYDKMDLDILERISVMNLRHSLCAVILFWLNQRTKTAEHRIPINVNKCIYNCLKTDFMWVNTKDFLTLLDR